MQVMTVSEAAKRAVVLALVMGFGLAAGAASPSQLEKEFDEAVAAGHPLAAERAWRELMSVKPQTAAIRYFRAAEVARETGKDNFYRDRLANFVRQEKNWTPEVEQAVRYLCRVEPSADWYIRLAQNVKPDADLLRVGDRTMWQLRNKGRWEEVLKIADLMLGMFTKVEERGQILNIFTNVDWNWQGFPKGKMPAFFMKYDMSDVPLFRELVRGRADYGIGPEWMIQYCEKHRKVWPRAAEYMGDLYNWWWNQKDAKKKRDELLPRVAKLAPLFWASKDNETRAAFFRVACNSARTYFDDATTNGHANVWKSRKAEEIYRGLKIDREKNPELFRDAYYSGMNSGIWNAAAAAEFTRDAGLVAYPNWVLVYTSEGNICEKARETKDGSKLRAFIAKYENDPKVPREYVNGLYWESWTAFSACKDVNGYKRVIWNYVRSNVNEANPDWLHEHIVQSWANFVSVDERVGWLKDLFALTGAQKYWLKFIERNEKEAQAHIKAKREGTPFGEVPSFKAWAQTVKNSKATSSDAFLRANTALYRLPEPNKGFQAESHKIMADAIAAFPGQFYPNKLQYPIETAHMEWMVRRYYEYCARGSSDDKRKYIETMMGKSGKDAPWGWMANFLRDDPKLKVDNDFKKKWAIAYLRNTQDYSWNGGWSGLSFYPISKTDETLAGEIDFKKISAAGLMDFCWGIAERRVSDKMAEKMMDGIFTAHPIKEYPRYRLQSIIWNLSGNVRTNAAFRGRIPWSQLEAVALDTVGNSREERYLTGNVLALGLENGRFEAQIKRYMAVLDKLPVEKALTYYNEMLDWRDFTGNYTFRKIGNTDWFVEVVAKKILPLMKKVATRTVPSYTYGDYESYSFHRLMERLNDYVANENRKEKTTDRDQKIYEMANQFYDEYERWTLAGAELGVDLERALAANGRMYLNALAKTNEVEMVKVARAVGLAMNGWNYDWGKVLNETAAAGANEALYLVTAALNRDGIQENLVTAATKYRAEVSRKLPGIYPVSEKDPAYPLYVAADELTRNNPERATKLLLSNLAVFEREAVNLPEDFTAWAVDQLRMQRGKKDALLLKSRAVATQVLEKEAKITPNLAAAMLLARAESFRDQQNFEAAKLEYQSIRNNPKYNTTEYGRKAMFRAVDLQIETGNASAAESTLEYWLSQPDTQVQAEAHYFLAKIAYERKDYDECIKQLREVFAINFTHTNARFLQGQWKLATNSEVDDTEVLIGNLSDRTAVRPGQQLAITVQDRNLSVAGGGSSIPVVVTTAPGGDREMVHLYPSVRDPNLFKGVIDVKLAKSVCSNLVLEVRGDDSVSYVIDPEFLKARGLPLNKPKVLKVVDDARLAIGAGAPRTEETDSTAQIEAMVMDGGATATDALSMSLRPGNPLYIAVSDKDRSLGGADDSVMVSVSTTSGDKLENVVLKEVSPCTGVFRGTVPTALPPPRAFASDTAVGFNAGDVINSTRDGKWQSLSDSQPGKWFEVDTMASHVVSNVTLKVPTPSEITSIRLAGSLAGATMRLGTLPAGDATKRVGLKYQCDLRGGFRGEDSIRDFMEKVDAPRATSVSNFVFKPDNNRRTMVARYSGAFMQPKGFDYLRLRVQRLAKTSDALRTLWVAIAIDGRTIFSGAGANLATQLISCEMLAGVHRLEVFVTAQNQADAFELMWEPLGSEPKSIPIEWFDAKAHPEIVDFVADRAVIKRTAEGFEATFAKPVRLRTIRWEFLGRTSPAVTVNEMSAMDADGKMILPVKSDFSDAQRNDTLEVAPGDRIMVRYADEATSSGDKKILEKSMGSSFNDADVGFYFEEIRPAYHGGEPTTMYREAYRFVPGDTLIVAVNDMDLDVSGDADKLEVIVETAAGEKRKMTLLEQVKDYRHWNSATHEEGNIHTGFFVGLLRTAMKDDANAHPKALKVDKNETLTISYEDRENTRPGVPCVRTSKVQAIEPTTPVLTLFKTRIVRSIDTSPTALARLEAIRRRPGNEKVEHLYREDLYAEPMERAESDSTNEIPVNVLAPVFVRVNDPSRARHDASKLTLEAVAFSELARAEAEGDDPRVERTSMTLGGTFRSTHLTKGAETMREARTAGSFNGSVYMVVGTPETASEDLLILTGRSGRGATKEELLDYPALIGVNGNDKVRLRIYDGETMLMERTLSLEADASLALMDSTWKAERTAAHVGERFFVQIKDADRDVTDDADRIRVAVTSLVSKVGRDMVLTETIPHSGIFNGVIRPIMFAPGEEIPSIVTGSVASTEMLIADDRFAVKYGDKLSFTYHDDRTLDGTVHTLCVTGTVHKGSDGTVRLFSKRFRDSDQAVLVQFRLAECLFEQAKEHRKLKQTEKSAEAIAKGKYILEEALKNYPDSAHLVQGEYLLANLYQELATEQKEAGNKDKAMELYAEALSRFSQLLAIWPEGDYAARAQYHKALCLEMLGDYQRAGEEYVKMTYLYPESELVGDATIRLATYYYKTEKRYDISARIYQNFQKRFPNHEKAPRALFMCGSCYVKEAEKLQAKAEEEAKAKGKELDYTPANVSLAYEKAVKAFVSLDETYRSSTTPELRAQALYWAGDVALRRRDGRNAYLFLKRTVLEYPETEWARRARGLLLQESRTFQQYEGE